MRGNVAFTNWQPWLTFLFRIFLPQFYCSFIQIRFHKLTQFYFLVFQGWSKGMIPSFLNNLQVYQIPIPIQMSSTGIITGTVKPAPLKFLHSLHKIPPNFSVFVVRVFMSVYVSRLSNYSSKFTPSNCEPIVKLST